MYGVVIPNKYEDVIAPLVKSIHEKIPSKPPIVIIADGHTNDYGFVAVKYEDPLFVYSKSVNSGIKALQGMDVILLNDDCRLLEWNFFDRLQQFAYSEETIGIMSPLVKGAVGTPQQRYWERGVHWSPEEDFKNINPPQYLCFPCVYIKRKVFDRIGLMNENIAGYGFDDAELCGRAQDAGFKTIVTQRITIQHGDGSQALGDGRGKSWATSFMRRFPTGSPTGKEIADYLKRKNQNGSTGFLLNKGMENY